MNYLKILVYVSCNDVNIIIIIISILAPFAILASATGASDPIFYLTSSHSYCRFGSVYMVSRSSGHSCVSCAAFSQKAWDFLRVQAVAQDLLGCARGAATAIPLPSLELS